jgi:high affinity Mn2+ porin
MRDVRPAMGLRPPWVDTGSSLHATGGAHPHAAKGSVPKPTRAVTRSNPPGSTRRPLTAALLWPVLQGGVAQAQPAPVAAPDIRPAYAPNASDVDRSKAVNGAAKDEPNEEQVSAHAQTTFIEQYHPPFRSPYSGALSLDPGSSGDETLSISAFLGGRLWRGAEFYVNPEALQGFGLSNTTGIVGFTNGEAFKVGTKAAVFRASRLFFRQTFALGGAMEAVESNANQLAGRRRTDRITITVGEYAVVDVFDDNGYAHDSRSGFLNWTINDMGAFDMASPAYNYTYGASAEWYQSWWAVRAGFFLEPSYPNSVDVDLSFEQYQPLLELEERHDLWGRPGKLKLLLFGKRVNAGSFSQALALAAATGQPPSTSLVRNGPVWGYGGGLNFEQEVTPDLGLFARLSAQNGDYEEFAFTQVQESATAGLVLTGARWHRENDEIGLGMVVNGIFSREQAYLSAGGTGIIIGDGALNYGQEEVAEIYYRLAPWDWAAVTLDYQFVEHPAYNRDRGPVSVFGARLHLEL